MEEKQGWVKIYRKILDNPIVCKDSETFSVWIYLLLNATHNEYEIIFKGKRIKLKSGQLITGRESISKKLKINESKVQRILKLFENEQQIEQQTSNKNRLITIVNWGLYQDNEQQIEQQVNNKRTTSEQQVNTNKNVKNNKNDNNVKNNINSPAKAEQPAPKETKKKYGEYKHVMLKDSELEKLKNDYPNYEELITYLDEYIEMKGYKAKSHYLAIKKWVVDAVNERKRSKPLPKWFNKDNQETNTTKEEQEELDKILESLGG